MEEIVRESPPSLLWCTQPAWLCPSPGDHYQARLKLIHKVVEGLGFWQLQHRSSFEMEGNVRVGEGGEGLKILVVITELISWRIVLRWGGVNRVQSEVTGKIFHHSVFIGMKASLYKTVTVAPTSMTNPGSPPSLCSEGV